MKSRVYSGITLLMVGTFLLFGAGNAFPQGKKARFQTVYKAPANPHPKVESFLLQNLKLVREMPKDQKSRLMKQFSARKPCPFRIDQMGRIQCYVRCRDLNPDTIKKLEGFGVRVQATDGTRRIVQTALTEEQIYRLETLSEVKFISLPAYPVTNVGSFTTEAYEAMDIHKFVNRPEFIGTNVTGQGMKVGVISSAIHLAGESAAQGDLPSTSSAQTVGNNVLGGVVYWSFRTDPFGQVYGERREGIEEWGGGFDQEGTAMLEIIHDIVPDAHLFFSNFDTDIQMNMSKDWLRNQGCDVIVDDIGWYNNGPYDGTSVVSMGSTRQVEHGVAYYTSVGNGAEDHWWGYFNDPEKNNFCNFAPKDESIEVRLMPGEIVFFYIAWEEPWGSYPPYTEGSGYDIDLWILDPNFLDMSNPYSYSTNLQLGDGDPVEACGIYNNTFDFQNVSIVITRKERAEPYDDATNPMRINLFKRGGSFFETQYQIENGSISNNSDAGGGVISVGAIDVNSPRKVVESFSSWGPTWDGRQKPEIACFDGTRSGAALQGTVFSTFFGTSCAAPHAAAVAALIKGYKVSMGDPNFTNPFNPPDVVDNINTLLYQGAVDLLPTGVDDMSGYGRINAANVFLGLLDPSIRSKRFDFAADEEGWKFVGIPGYFTEAAHNWDTGALVLQGVDFNTYGSWESPLIVFDDGLSNLNPAKIYKVRFNVSTSSLPTQFPGFRLRINDGRNTVAHVRDYNSNEGSDHYPGKEGTDYFINFKPTASEAMNGVYLSFDIVNFDSKNDISGILNLNDVEITEED